MAQTLVAAAQAFSNALVPLTRALAGTDDHLIAYFRKLGWSLPEVPEALKDMRVASDQLVAAVATLEQVSRRVSDGIGSEDDLERPGAEFLLALTAFSASFAGVPAGVRSQLPAEFIAATHIDEDVQRRLFDDLLSRELEYQSRAIYLALRVWGLVESVFHDADPARFQPAFEERTIRWDRISLLGAGVGALMRDVYGWGTPTLDGAKLFLALRDLSFAILSPAYFDFSAGNLLSAILPDLPPSAPRQPGLLIPLLQDTPLELALGWYTLPKQQPDELQGLVLTLAGLAGIHQSFTLTPTLSLKVDSEIDLASGIALALWPDRPPKILGNANTTGSALLTGGSAKVSIQYAPLDGDTTRLPFLSFSGFTLDARGLSVEGGVGMGSSGGVDAWVEAALSKLRAALGGLGQDSFLSQILPSDAAVEFDLTVGWSLSNGFYWGGGTGLEVHIPISLRIGPVQIDEIAISFVTQGQTLGVSFGLTASTSIGPVLVEVEGLGVAVAVSSKNGNFGPVDLGFSALPPTGVGLSVDVAGLVGGGFIGHDPAKHEYAGMLQLEYHSYKLLAFGLLSTVLPTGPGYSLVVMVDAEFPPIQLGLGFTLAGAGGMLGVHRTASVDALRNALKAHTLSNLLFPTHPIENAPQLLTELDTLFPPTHGRFVFGPIVRIEWGTPALLTLDLALVLELPAPVRLILISELTVLLPRPDAVLVEIHLSALGTIDFGKSEGALDAVLHDSRLLRFVLHGAMALRVTWAGNKTFLLAVGGTHPKFQLPPGFPKLDRLGISLASGSITKLNLDGYLAVTSNTLQIGAHVDLFVGVDGFGISGFLTFDTLIQRHPFHFDGDISGAVTLSVAGDDVMALKMAASLIGPAPWHAAGSVTFDVLWWSVTKSFSATFGESGVTERLEQVNVGQLLRGALGDPRSFSPTLAADVSALVTLIAPVTASTTVAAHPGAGLSVHQTVVPLGLTISQYGGGVPAGETLFAITSVSAGGVEQHEPPPVFDDFAPAQYLTFGDDERLASPSFERLAAGVEIVAPTTFGAATASSAALVRPIAYETWLVDTRDGPARPADGPSTPLPVDHLRAVLLDGAVGRSSLARGGTQRYVGPRRAVVPAELDFVVATSDELASSGVGAPAGKSYSQARAALDVELALHPERRGALLVTPRYEVSP